MYKNSSSISNLSNPFYQTRSPSTSKQPDHNTQSIVNACLQVTPRVLGLIIELVEAELINEAKGHASVLKHVVEGEVLNLVVGGVDVRVGELKGRLDDEGGRVASLGGRGVVGAGVATLGLNPRDVAVLHELVCQTDYRG